MDLVASSVGRKPKRWRRSSMMLTCSSCAYAGLFSVDICIATRDGPVPCQDQTLDDCDPQCDSIENSPPIHLRRQLYKMMR